MSGPVLGRRLTQRRPTLQDDYVVAPLSEVDPEMDRYSGGLVGDVRFEEVELEASDLTPVPGGVGPMTRAVLLFNALQAARAGVDE